MASIMRVCRVCGKEYESCHSVNRNANVFRWQDVACSPECGATYLDRVNESRGIVSVQKKNKHKKETFQPAVLWSEDEPAEEQADEALADETFAESAEDK